MTRFQPLNLLHRLHPAYSFRNGFDFTTIPVEDAARLLRTLGDTLFQALLAGESRPDLAKLTGDKAWSALQHPMPGWVWQTMYPRRDSYRLVMKARSRQPNDLWQGQFVRQIALEMQLTQRFRAPDTWWELIGQRAWLDLNFQRRVRYAVIKHMKTSVLFSLSQLPHPRFHPNSFWLLIALTEAPASSPYWRFRRRQGIASTLHRIAVRQSLNEHWASIWDQWLIITAILSWHKEQERPAPELWNAILALPLLRQLLSKHWDSIWKQWLSITAILRWRNEQELISPELRNAIMATPLWRELPPNERYPAILDSIPETSSVTLARDDEEDAIPSWLPDYFRIVTAMKIE